MLGALSFLAVLYISIFFHELGHALALHFLGGKIKSFRVGLFTILKFNVGQVPVTFGLLPILGGVEPDQKSFEELSDLKHLVVTLAGPLFTLMLFFTALSFYYGNLEEAFSNGMSMIGYAFSITNLESFLPDKDANFSVAQDKIGNIVDTQGIMGFLIVLAVVNVAMFVFNILPIPGLDGGRSVLSIVNMIFGKKARPITEALNILGILVILGFLLVSFALDIFFSF